MLHPTGVLFLNLGDSYNGSGGAGGDYNDGGLKEGQPKYKGARMEGLKPKDLIGVPWECAFALRADGWWLRQEIIWAKTSPMPESVTDRCTKAHEQVFLLAKSREYFFDNEAIREPNESGSSGWAKQRQNGIDTNQYIKHDSRKFAVERHDKDWINRVDTSAMNGRNKRSVWTLGPEQYSGSHYAVMPTKLVEPCILAGTSAKGCCSACGAPWERVVEREAATPGQKPGYNRDCGARNDGDRAGRWVDAKSTTLGWQPTCTCFGHFELVDAPRDYDEDGDETVASQLRPARRVFVADGDIPEPVPCTVLDPFAGSGTTLAVALKFGRRAIGIDLDERNMKLVHERIAKMQPMLFSEVTA